tara:strand:- start:31 stop:309 length:279 start_codon:yes stop_codon:yes gene_type:complete
MVARIAAIVALNGSDTNRIVIGDDYIPEGYTEIFPFLEQTAKEKRNELLSASDSMALADRITDEWRTYRQALRDLPTQAGFPTSITWPVEPS